MFMNQMMGLIAPVMIKMALEQVEKRAMGSELDAKTRDVTGKETTTAGLMERVRHEWGTLRDRGMSQLLYGHSKC